MRRRRIAIACQGGGSQCAFVAGALKTLFDEGIHHRYEVVGLSGTSGGAITAAAAWLGLLAEKQGDPLPVGKRIEALWRDLTAQSPQEIAFDAAVTGALRTAERGLIPTVATSPSSPMFRFLTQMVSTWLGRPEFTDLRALLLKHIDFERADKLIEERSPVLLVGAGDVREGTFKIFSSMNREIRVESLLASAAIPTLFPAVWVDGHAYWDGIFAANPPVTGFLRPALMGMDMLPDEIWVVQVNPSQYDDVPEESSEIFDRRNRLAGNLSLQHELHMILLLNHLLREGLFTDAFRERFGLQATEVTTLRFIRMSSTLARSLDYPSKLSRRPSHIARMMADGQAQAREFMAMLPAGSEWRTGERTEQTVGLS